MRILIIEDDQHMANFLKTTLESESFAVDLAYDGEQGSYFARTNDYDLIILDNILPKKTGLEVCREIRANGKHTPILMLSVQSEIYDKTSLLDSGADDYMTKPYSHQELVSRIRAIARRGTQAEKSVLTAGDIVLNTQSQEVTVAGKKIYLTRKEFGLLELFLKHKGTVVSRGMIMEHVWDMTGDPFSKTIETHMVNLRRKIETKKRIVIINVPGRGYKIE